MTLTAFLRNTFLKLPAIGAPMFLDSFPPLVKALCKVGIVGAFPHVNARASAQFDAWLTELETDLGAFRSKHPDAIFAPRCVNRIVHRSNPCFDPDLEIVVAHKVPLTCLGHPGEVIEAVHGYGGTVLSDVINAKHACKAIDAGADGVVCVAGGAGRHASNRSAFWLLREVREFWDGCLVLGGCGLPKSAAVAA